MTRPGAGALPERGPMDPFGVIPVLRATQEAMTRIAQASGAVQDAANDLAELIEKLQLELARALAGAPLAGHAAADLSFSLAKIKAALGRILPEPENPVPRRRQKWQQEVNANVIHIKR